MQVINQLPLKSKHTTENGNKRRIEVFKFIQSGADVAKVKKIEPELTAEIETRRYKSQCVAWARRNFDIELKFHTRQSEVFVCKE